ncbi:MAG: type II toxin-antitoxin system death-on-curing family toxin [Phycisphaerae bacterium]|nr:type II toxin-antitoxin system death-on-curing family toxin [Phycisphaerae bacterium]
MNFLILEDILAIHADQIALYGGEDGVRDIGLLDSALAQPRATFDGEFLHGDVFEMAAAYVFHIVQNHPFVDGNKRAGIVAAVVFLDFNGIHIDAPKGSLYNLTLSVARGEVGKERIAEFFRGIAS